MHTGFWWENLREGEHLEDPDVDGRIILKLTIEKWGWGYGLDRSDLGEGQVAGLCEYGNELPGSIKRGEFLG